MKTQLMITLVVQVYDWLYIIGVSDSNAKLTIKNKEMMLKSVVYVDIS